MSRLALVLLAALTLAAGAARADDVPGGAEGAEVLARRAIDHVRNGRPEALRELFAPEIRPRVTDEIATSIREQIGSDGPLTLEQLLYGINLRTTPGGTWKILELEYQLHTQKGYFRLQTRVLDEDGRLSLVGFHTGPLPGDVHETSALRFSGLSGAHYVFLLLALCAPCLVVLSLYRLSRSKLRHKWAWALFALVGVSILALEWKPDGKLYLGPFGVLPMGSSVTQADVFSPWVVKLGVPLGALVVLVKTRRREDEAGAAQPSP